MENWKLWEKVVCAAIWTLIALFTLFGILGGAVYLIDRILTR